MSIETTIHLNKFAPRPYQLKFCRAFEEGKYKKFLLCWGRRSGKDFTLFNLVLRAALRKVGSYFYCLPTFKQARLVIWDAITMDSARFLDCIPRELIKRLNQQEMVIELVNGSIIRLIGSDTYDTSLVGTNPVMVIFSEYALADDRAYKYVRPILNANEGTVVVCSTPRGHNSFYDLYQIAKNHPDWYCEKLGLAETQHIDLEVIKEEIRSGEISEELAQQEYFCFPGGQEVLTVNGMVPIEQVKKGDQVYTHNGRLRNVEFVFSRHYKSDLIKIITYGTSEPLICTADHRLRVLNPTDQTYSWKSAGLITRDDLLVFPKMSLLNATKVISYELCMLLAWYITEGSSSKNSLMFSVGNQQEVDQITSYLIKENIDYHVFESKKQKGFEVFVYSTRLADFFKSYCGSGAINKHIPLSLIQGYEEQFFYELIKGDGCHFKNNREEKYCYTTISKSLAYQVQFLAHSLNNYFAAGITERKPFQNYINGRLVIGQRSYIVNIYVPNKWRKAKFNNLRRATHGIGARIKSIERIKDYDDQVYNLKVDYEHTYIVNGRAVHNCSFDLGVEGSYYGRYMDKMRLESRIGQVPWEPGFPVHVAFDLGMRDSTAIIFFQVIGTVIHVIDYHENHSQGLEYYARFLQDKPYTYGKIIAPHDIQVRELGTGMSRLEKALSLGIRFTLAPNLLISDGIEAVRTMLPRTWIDEANCAQLIKCLENYRREFDTKRKVYNERPNHDQFSHGADSARYMAISLSKLAPNSSPDELEKRYNEVMQGEEGRIPHPFRQPSNY